MIDKPDRAKSAAEISSYELPEFIRGYFFCMNI